MSYFQEQYVSKEAEGVWKGLTFDPPGREPLRNFKMSHPPKQKGHNKDGLRY